MARSAGASVSENRGKMGMNQEKKSKKWLIWGLLALGEAALAVLIARWQGLDAANPLPLNARWLSDGCFVVGLMTTGVGLMTWVATTGFFDIMSYGVQYGVRALVGLFGGSRKPNNQNFYEYKAEREAKRGRPVYAILLSGIAFIALSLLFLMIYYRA